MKNKKRKLREITGILNKFNPDEEEKTLNEIKQILKDEYKGYIACDFDAVISTYVRPFKFNKLGKPVKEIIETLEYYYNKGYYVYIFTGRQLTPTMKKWLEDNKVKYHAFNVDPKPYDFTSRFKVFFDVIIDDKAVNFHYKNNRKSKKELIKEIDKVLKWSRE